MIKEDYCSFELSKKLKDKGFPQEGPGYSRACFHHLKDDLYRDGGDWINTCATEIDETEEEKIIVPTLALARKWLYEEKHIWVQVEITSGKKFVYDMWDVNVDNLLYGTDFEETFDSPQEAFENGINDALDLI